MDSLARTVCHGQFAQDFRLGWTVGYMPVRRISARRIPVRRIQLDADQLDADLLDASHLDYCIF